MISVIVPAFNEGKGLAYTFATLERVLSQLRMPFEIIFVDDGSVDETWTVISHLKPSDSKNRVKGVRFSRNFGKEAAILAGLSASEGECTVVMDADLQHPPEKIPEMVHLWKQGYEVVEGKKADRGEESAVYRWLSKRFYGILSNLSGLDMKNSSDFKLLDRRVVDVILSMPERNTFFRALSFWAGFRRTQVIYEVKDRQFGDSKWSPAKLLRYGFRNIASFSTFPMELVTILGGVFFVVAFVMSLIALVQKIAGKALGGFTTVIILQMFMGSIIMFSLGVIGFYIAQIFEEVKRRPRYIVAEQMRSDEKSKAEIEKQECEEDTMD